jgi:putative MATE family efflux protein
MVKDLTKGNITKLIVSFCIPLILGNLFQQLYSITDGIIVGKFVSKEALAGIGSTVSINSMVIGCIIGMCNGLCIKIAHSFGSKDYTLLRKYFVNACYVCLFFAVILTAATQLFTKNALVLMDTPTEIFEHAYHYIIIMFAGIPFIILYNFLACVLRALGDSKTPLRFLMIAYLLNILLDITFLLIFHLGTRGAGYATVISQAASGILCFFYIKKKYPILKISKSEMGFDMRLILNLIRSGVPMGLQVSITAIGSILIQAVTNTLGTNIVTGVAVAATIQTFGAQPMETLGITMAAYCGQNKGAKNYERITQGMKKALTISIVYCILALIVTCFGSSYIALLFVNSSETSVIAAIVKFSMIQGMFYPALGVLFVFRYALQGLGYNLLPMLAGAAELLGRSVTAFALVGSLGYTAVCLASPAAWLAADILLFTTYAVKIRKLKVQLA